MTLAALNIGPEMMYGNRSTKKCTTFFHSSSVWWIYSATLGSKSASSYLFYMV